MSGIKLSKAQKLLDAITIGQVIKHNDFHYRINSAGLYADNGLAVNVTFVHSPTEAVTRDIVFINPPLKPRKGDDLRDTLSEMLESAM